MSGVVWPREFALAPEKITGDLLDPDHPDGGSKAAFFLRFGFNRASPSQLGFALRGHAIPDNFIRETISSRGDVKFVCEGPLATPDGRCPRARTVWQVDAQMRGHFVTAYPIGTAGAA